MITITYCNYKGKTSVRRIEPKSMEFMATKYHPIPQWLLVAYDVDKKAIRRFALKDIKNWQDVIVADQERLLDHYCRNWSTRGLKTLMGLERELARINKHHGLKWTQEQLDLVITTAIKRQEEA